MNYWTICYILHLCAANQAAISYLHVTLFLPEVFHQKVKSINLLMEIIWYITECYTCIYRGKCSQYLKFLKKAKNAVFFPECAHFAKKKSLKIYEKRFLFHLKYSFHNQDIAVFVIFLFLSNAIFQQEVENWNNYDVMHGFHKLYIAIFLTTQKTSLNQSIKIG